MERNDGSKEQLGWNDILGPFMRLGDVLNYFSEDALPNLIVLKTKDGTEVCPIGQFRQSITEDGKTEYEIVPEVPILWRITELSNMGEWTRAAAIIAPRQDQERSLVDIVTDPGSTDAARRKAVQWLLGDEYERAVAAGDVENYKQQMREILESYGVDWIEEGRLRGFNSETGNDIKVIAQQ